jgi:hypothetical protein
MQLFIICNQKIRLADFVFVFRAVGWPKNWVISVVIATVMMSLIVVCINGSNVVTIMTLKC